MNFKEITLNFDTAKGKDLSKESSIRFIRDYDRFELKVYIDETEIKFGLLSADSMGFKDLRIYNLKLAFLQNEMN